MQVNEKGEEKKGKGGNAVAFSDIMRKKKENRKRSNRKIKNRLK